MRKRRKGNFSFLFFCLYYSSYFLVHHLITRLNMYHDTSHIREVFLDIILDLVCDEVSYTNSLLAIDEDMELNDTIEATLTCDTEIHILNF